jgi:exopolysaccharide biosynthesis protein
MNQEGKRSRRNNKVTNKKRKLSVKLLLGFIVFQIFFTAITAPFVLLYGPFENAKKTFIGTAMDSMHYQWLATTFMSKENINSILGINEGANAETEVSNESVVEIPKVKDDSITCYPIKGKDGAKFNGYVLEVTDPTRVKVGVSSMLGTEGEKTSEIAKNNNAIAAINGGAFTDESNGEAWTQNGGIPTGLILQNGEVKYNDIPENEKRETVAITKDGLLLAGRYSLNDLKKKNASEALTFGPVLISGGSKVSVPEKGTAPKTLIGQKANGTMVLVVLDSNSDTRMCATMKEAQDVMYNLDCVTAINLDGGKSTTMYYDGEVVNNPSNPTGERTIASGFIVK